MLSQLVAQSIDPRAGVFPGAPAHPDLEYRVAVPLVGPWYRMSPWAWSDAPQESFYNPRTYPFPAINPFLPQRSGAFIQPGNLDPLAYRLVHEGGSLDGLGQAPAPSGQAVKFAVGTWIAFAILKSAAGAFIPRRKIRKLVRGVGPKGAMALGVVAAGGLAYWFLFRREALPQVEVSLLGLDQVGQPWAPEDPTGGAYGGGGDPIYGDPLGPGENIAVTSVWAGSLKPRGFATTTV